MSSVRWRSDPLLLLEKGLMQLLEYGAIDSAVGCWASCALFAAQATALLESFFFPDPLARGLVAQVIVLTDSPHTTVQLRKQHKRTLLFPRESVGVLQEMRGQCLAVQPCTGGTR